ncbi:MAG: hypothetical protein ACW99A_24205, partial [Candidatus Kariarchaeaceae archaeon]
MNKSNNITMFILTIFINSIAVILLLNNRNPIITFFVVSVFLITPTIIAQAIERYIRITVEDERREFIIEDASRMTVNHYVPYTILAGALLTIMSLIAANEGLSIDALNVVSFGAITLLTSGLLIAWIFAFAMDVQQKFKSGIFPESNLKDIFLGILRASLIFLYVNHYAVLYSGDENSAVSSFINSEQNWFFLFFILSGLNFIVFKINIAKFGPNDEMLEALIRASSTFTLKLATLVLLT